MQTLVQLQTRMIRQQIHLAEEQQVELQEKNQQLFRHVNELRQSRGRYETAGFHWRGAENAAQISPTNLNAVGVNR